jgi:predicted unusual protein kinase regulating ubiquinone biosynthesis (AarF/ABC1/UbiB family)
MNIICNLYSKLGVLLCKVKYIIYFNIFLSILFINYVYYKLWNVLNNKLTSLLNFSIKLNGCVIIKLIQWINTNLEIFLINSKNNEFLSQLFLQYYENCPVHDLKYTKGLFLKEFGVAFDTYFELDNTFIIKSGSIAQVYKGYMKNNNTSVAIKVVHPEIEYQLLCPVALVNLYTYLVTNFKCLKKYDIIIDLDAFFCNLEKQICMENEFANNEYFYNTYCNNVVIIPKPLMKSKNFLIMEFVDGQQIEDLDISDYKKQILISFIAIFIKDTFINGKYVHCDLHQGNWKIYKELDTANEGEGNYNYKIIIYDFGYVIENKRNDALKNLTYYIDTNDVYGLGNLIFSNVTNIDISYCNKDDFIERIIKHGNNSYPYSDSMIISLLTFCYINGYKLENNILDYFISAILLNRHFKKYLFLNYEKTGFDQAVFHKYVYNTNMFYISICEKYDVFHNVKDYLYDTYINKSVFSEEITYTNNYFDTLKSIDFDVSLNHNSIILIDI